MIPIMKKLILSLALALLCVAGSCSRTETPYYFDGSVSQAVLERYLARHDAPVKTLTQLIGYNQQYRVSEMPYFGQELFEMANAKGGLGDSAYIRARSLARRLAGPEGIDAALKAQQLDALIAPAANVAPSMIEASSSWMPFSFSAAPCPALKCGLSSMTTTAASTASGAVPPAFSTP